VKSGVEEEQKIDLQLVPYEHALARPNSIKKQFIFWFTFNVVTNGPRIEFLRPLLHPIFGQRNWWDEVIPGLLLGALPIINYGHENLPEYCANKVRPLTGVVSCCSHSELKGEGLGVIPVSPQFWAERNIRQDHLAMADFTGMIQADHSGVLTPEAQELQCLQKIHQSILNMHDDLEGGNSVYVHCKAGRGRSVLVVICYLIFFYNMTPHEATEFTRSKRPEISLSPVQIAFISKYCKQYRPELAANSDDSMALVPYQEEPPQKISWFETAINLVARLWLGGEQLTQDYRTLQNYITGAASIEKLLTTLSRSQAKALQAGLNNEYSVSHPSLYLAAQRVRRESDDNQQPMVDQLTADLKELKINETKKLK